MYNKILSKTKSPSQHVNPNEYTYVHSSGFSATDYCKQEGEIIRLYSNFAGFAIILMFFLRGISTQPITSAIHVFTDFITIITGLEGYLEFFMVKELTTSLSYTLSMILPFVIYMALVNIPSAKAVPNHNTKASFVISGVFISLGLSSLGSLTGDAFETALSFVNITSLQPEFNAPTNIPAFIIFLVNLVVLPPLVEEWVFRGVLLQSLRRFGDGFAIMVSSVIFALIHCNVSQSTTAFLVGLSMAIFVVITGSVWTGVIIHMVNNCLSIAMSIITLAMPEYAFVLSICLHMVYLIGGVMAILHLWKKHPQLFTLYPAKTFTSFRAKNILFFSSVGMISALFIIGAITLNYLAVN